MSSSRGSARTGSRPGCALRAFVSRGPALPVPSLRCVRGDAPHTGCMWRGSPEAQRPWGCPRRHAGASWSRGSCCHGDPAVTDTPPPLAPTGHTPVRTAPLCSPSSPGNRVCHRPPPRGVESPHQGWPGSHLSGRSDHRPLRGSPRLCPHSTRTLCSRVPVAVTLTGPHTRPRTLITACLLPSRLRDWPCPPSVASSSHRGTLPWEGSRGPKAGQEPGSR